MNLVLDLLPLFQKGFLKLSILIVNTSLKNA